MPRRDTAPPDYRSLCDALSRLDRLPPGSERDRAAADLRAALQALPPDDLRRLFREVQRAALARRANDTRCAARHTAQSSPPPRASSA